MSNFASVPVKIVEQIESELREKILCEIVNCGKFSQKEIDNICHIISEKTLPTVKNEIATVDGYSLKKVDIIKIAFLIKNHKRIKAIIKIREITGRSLRDCRDFIHKFPSGKAGAADFINAFNNG